MVEHSIETQQETLLFINKENGKYLAISFFEGKSDSSGYLTINSMDLGVPDFLKISYHPKNNELRYAFTNEFWSKLNKPNKERKLFIAKPTNSNQILANIYLDNSALFRGNLPRNKYKGILVSSERAVSMCLKFENRRLVLVINQIAPAENIKGSIRINREKIYNKSKHITPPISGCAQILLSDNNLPLKILVFGI